MPDIVLLCATHKENGKCNSNELARILEHIVPDVLFQELPYFEFLEKNNLGNGSLLEIDAISKYLRKHNVLQVPVDTFDGSSDESNKFGRVVGQISQTNPHLRKLLDLLMNFQLIHGIEFINSRINDSILQEVDSVILKSIEHPNSGVLLAAWNEWKLYNENREKIMIKNIYEFCRENNFERGVFLFGSGHRRSLISKIRLVKNTELIRLNWKLYYGANKLLERPF